MLDEKGKKNKGRSEQWKKKKRRKWEPTSLLLYSLLPVALEMLLWKRQGSENSLSEFDGHVHTAIFTVDNQQGPTV